ncbi:phosphoribosylglycinamide formyltransferase [Candidatus Planktophila lacus]|uniref:Phosphoribosylglycinamide formyltransferase n=1 Tax=Candidatus Planktophila lacus TaxID=1884913 RepID=A0AAD0E4U3_9ACTN|nr:phosphoribosylglycinamide formyltransferase [Candidatus Planktophila lacus]ASY10986.1 phosphoribosylglycinamide formyltransferase 1 [Candidatus Planktophila lacus]
MTNPRIVILASGSGSIAQAIIDAQHSDDLKAEIACVISDQASARVLERAEAAGIPTKIIAMTENRTDWDKEIVAALTDLQPDLIASAGFMRILSADCVSKFKIVNSHPALLPLFPGAHAVRDALAAGARKTGTTIHWVDAGVDTGALIAQEEVEITPSDTEESLHERIKIVERRLYVATLQQLLNESVRSHD